MARERAPSGAHPTCFWTNTASAPFVEAVRSGPPRECRAAIASCTPRTPSVVRCVGRSSFSRRLCRVLMHSRYSARLALCLGEGSPFSSPTNEVASRCSRGPTADHPGWRPFFRNSRSAAHTRAHRARRSACACTRVRLRMRSRHHPPGAFPGTMRSRTCLVIARSGPHRCASLPRDHGVRAGRRPRAGRVSAGEMLSILDNTYNRRAPTPGPPAWFLFRRRVGSLRRPRPLRPPIRASCRCLCERVLDPPTSACACQLIGQQAARRRRRARFLPRPGCDAESAGTKATLVVVDADGNAVSMTTT